MTKAEKYIKDNPEYEIYLVEKKFGNGKQLIQFFYRTQVNWFKQGFLAYVDNQKWERDRHDVMDEVQNYLAENIEEFVHDDFKEEYECDFNDGLTNLSYEEFYEENFEDWLKEQFPKIDLEYDGVCYFDKV